MRHWIVLGSAALLLASGCASVPQTTGKETTTETMTEIAPATEAVLQTSKGEIVFKFHPEDAPKTVENFVTLARKGFYDGLKFHRVVPNFVIQGGDPSGDGSGGPGYTIPAEFNSRSHLTGTVAMARALDPNSAGSQFYICLARQPNLDGQYTVFGQVTSGMDVVQAIRVGDKMIKVTVR